MEGVHIALIAEPVGIRYIRSGFAHEAVGYQWDYVHAQLTKAGRLGEFVTVPGQP